MAMSGKKFDTRGAAIRKISWCVVNLSLILCCFFVAPMRAQDAKVERKLLTRVEPEYPPVLRMRQIGGTVRLEITITPKGTVEDAKVLGGNPVLAESAINAVRKWKYVAAESATTATISIEFNPFR